MPSTPSSASNNAVFSVSQLNERARQLLEISFSGVRVEGEISNLARPSSGHWYFTLKDSSAQIRCAMFRSRTNLVKFQPKEGDKVELRGKVSLYANRGDYQLIVDQMKPAGEGALLLAYQQLKQKLTAEGLFDPASKRPLPAKINRVALITSPTGAAIHDMLTVLRRRWPLMQVDYYPSMVQGQLASGELIRALQYANRDQRADVIIIGRGGGSLEDLWCFNDEALARKIAASDIPVISAVGHEVDYTIADFVADLRAPTPSAAAEMISPDQTVLKQDLDQQLTRLVQNIGRRLYHHQQQLTQWQQRLRNPQQLLGQQAQRLDMAEIRLHQQQKLHIHNRHQRIAQLQQRLANQHPQKQLDASQLLLKRLHQRLQRAVDLGIRQQQQKLTGRVALLQSLSPLNVLARGYSITRHSDGRVIQDTKSLGMGDQITTTLKQGTLVSEIISCQPNTSDKLE